jgi:hypothetical protein
MKFIDIMTPMLIVSYFHGNINNWLLLPSVKASSQTFTEANFSAELLIAHLYQTPISNYTQAQWKDPGRGRDSR